MNPEVLQLIRKYKIQNVSDEEISNKLSATYSLEEITKGLAALEYMRPANQAKMAIPPPSHNPDAPPTFNIETVKSIIEGRKGGTRNTMVLVALILIAIVLFDASISETALLIIAIIVYPLLFALYVLNARNYNQLQPSYRRWNMWIYNYGSKFVIVSSTLSVLSNLKKFANPFYGFKDPSASRADLLLDTALETTAGVLAYLQLKPAQYIEEYFKQSESLQKTAPTQSPLNTKL